MQTSPVIDRFFSALALLYSFPYRGEEGVL